MLRIEKGVALPDKGSDRISEFTKTLRAMEVGDSFVTDKDASKCHVYFRSARNGKFTMRKVPEGLRVWRTE